MPNKYLGNTAMNPPGHLGGIILAMVRILLPFVPKTGNIILGKLWQVKCIIQKLVTWPLQNGLKRRNCGQI